MYLRDGIHGDKLIKLLPKNINYRIVGYSAACLSGLYNGWNSVLEIETDCKYLQSSGYLTVYHTDKVDTNPMGIEEIVCDVFKRDCGYQVKDECISTYMGLYNKDNFKTLFEVADRFGVSSDIEESIKYVKESYGGF